MTLPSSPLLQDALDFARAHETPWTSYPAAASSCTAYPVIAWERGLLQASRRCTNAAGVSTSTP